MHKIAIPQTILDQTLERRGELHALADFDPSRTALLVVDMQRFFIDMVPSAKTVTGNINRLADSLRNAGGRVVWIRMTQDENDRANWSHFHRKLLSRDASDAHVTGLARDSHDWQLWDELDARPEDEYSEKRRFSALIQGSSDLEPRLKDLSIQTLLITGTVTNICCESTARDAMMLDYETIMVADGCEALDDASHLASLCNFQTIFGDVFTTDELVQRIDRAAAADRRAQA